MSYVTATLQTFSIMMCRKIRPVDERARCLRSKKRVSITVPVTGKTKKETKLTDSAQIAYRYLHPQRRRTFSLSRHVLGWPREHKSVGAVDTRNDEEQSDLLLFSPIEL
jgi:hypothetical protein